jgi:hypothetical protein
MDEKLEKFLESSTVVWDNYKGPAKPIPVTIFVDAIGGVWDLKNLVAPCGAVAECRGNAYRQYYFCERHPQEGMLVLQYHDGSFYWFPGKEVKKDEKK